MQVNGVQQQRSLNSYYLIYRQSEQQAALYVCLCCYQKFCSEVRLWFAILLFADIYLYGNGMLDYGMR